ncbi:MAG: heme ABC transporter ATP-binding protein [Dehalococcoidia bacterium]
MEARSVTFRVGGRTLVDNVSFALHPGEVLALVGPNGAGKSTLLRLLSGDLPPSSGQIRLNGDELHHLGARAQSLRRAVMAQSTRVPVAFRAYDVVLMGRYPHLGDRHEGKADRELAALSMERTASDGFAGQIYPTLSGGEGARVQLARVLTQQTPVLLLDEPTAALDLRHQHSALAIAREVAEGGGAVLAVLHDLNLAASYADRIGLMASGELVALGTPWDVLRPSLLADVYGVSVVVQPHPCSRCPLVIVDAGRQVTLSA